MAKPIKLKTSRRACISLVGDLRVKPPQPLDSRFRGNDGMAAPTKLIQVPSRLLLQPFKLDDAPGAHAR